MRPVLSQSIQVLSLAIVSSAMLLNSCDNFSSAQEQSEDLAIQDASVEEPIQSDSAAASPRDVSPVAVEEPPSAASSNIPDPQPSGDLAQPIGRPLSQLPCLLRFSPRSAQLPRFPFVFPVTFPFMRMTEHRFTLKLKPRKTVTKSIYPWP